MIDLQECIIGVWQINMTDKIFVYNVYNVKTKINVYSSMYQNT